MSDVQVIVDGKAYSGWKSVDIDVGIEQLAGHFELTVSEIAPSGDAAKDLVDGAKVAVTIDDTAVITGFIDDHEISHNATEHTILIRGRDAAGDLVDCSAIYKTGQWTDRGMLSIVEDLVADYKIKVTKNTNLGEPFATWNIEPGESVFENIDRLARHRGVLVVSDGLGGIVITQPGTEIIGTSLVLGENILGSRLARSCRQRYSEYNVLGDRQRDDFNEPDDTKPRGRAKDSYIKRHRPFVCCYEDSNATIKSLNDRAKWQSNVNAGKSQRVVITVQGWKHASGLWQPNKQVTVTDELVRLNNATLLIAGVRYLLNEQGTVTELTLAPRDSLLVDKIPEEIAI